MFEVTVEDTFAAGHYLRNYKGKCENPHGHNYKIRVTLAGSVASGNAAARESEAPLAPSDIVKMIVRQLVRARSEKCQCNVRDAVHSSVIRSDSGRCSSALCKLPYRK